MTETTGYNTVTGYAICNGFHITEKEADALRKKAKALSDKLDMETLDLHYSQCNTTMYPKSVLHQLFAKKDIGK